MTEEEAGDKPVVSISKTAKLRPPKYISKLRLVNMPMFNSSVTTFMDNYPFCKNKIDRRGAVYFVQKGYWD